MKKKLHLAMLVSGLVVSVALLAWVFYGVATGEEAGFAHAERVWDHVPLTVGCAGYVPAEDEACDIAEDVVSTINTRLGFKMLAYQGHDSAADIYIAMRAPVEVGGEDRDAPGGHFELSYMGITYERCEVFTMNVSGGASDLEWVTLYHEVGCHCLGLAHDDLGIGSNNACKPMQRPTPDGMQRPWISDSDRRLLRERYKS